MSKAQRRSDCESPTDCVATEGRREEVARIGRVEFFIHYEGRESSHSPLTETFRDLGLDFHVVAPGIRLEYRRRVWLYLIGWPRLLWFSLCQALKSLCLSRPPDVIVAWSHLVLLPLVLGKWLLFRRTPKLVLMGFIHTPRRSRLHNVLRQWYFRLLLSRLSIVVCHSRHETARLPEVFRLPRELFMFVPFGTHVNRVGVPPSAQPYLFSAGRSSRDYQLLLRVAARVPYPLRIACGSLAQESLPPNVSVLRNCHGSDYLRELTAARLVVIPLSEDAISAGQMVLLEAMALGKPVIVSDTVTTREYVTHLDNAFLVDQGCDDPMQAAIERLWNDAELAETIGSRARQTFVNRHSLESYARNIVECLKRISPSCDSRPQHEVP